ncbi:MAG: hypothetical protein JRJ19_13565, partial [Deltaproteobacteria bacterium]|nr:hypothetical protein [Deltaproteobacteria bacterium]
LSAPTFDSEYPERVKITVTVAEDAPLTARDVTVTTGANSLTALAAFQIEGLTQKDSEGCGCAATPLSPAAGLFFVLGILFLAMRRRPD